MTQESVLLKIKEEIGEFKNEFKSIRSDIKVLAEIVQKQVKHEEKIYYVEKQIQEIKDEINSCPEGQNIQNLQKDMDKIRADFTKVGFALAGSIIGIVGLFLKLKGS